MKYLFLTLLFLLLSNTIVYGTSCNQIISHNIGNPEVTYNELNKILKQGGCMYMSVSKVLEAYSLVDFAQWEIVFKNGKVVYADNYIKDRDKEKEGEMWLEKFMQSEGSSS
jgi:uncharacterized protein YwgA